MHVQQPAIELYFEILGVKIENHLTFSVLFDLVSLIGPH